MIGQCLDMHSEFASIEIHSTQPRMSIRNGYGRLYMEREKGGLAMHSTIGKLSVDCSACRAQMGIKSATDSIRENADKGRQAVLVFIGKTAEEGDLLGDIGRNRDALHQIALRRAYPTPQREGYSLPVQPEISWLPGSLEMKYTPDKLSFSSEIVPTQTNCIPGEVQIRLAKRAHVYIKYTGMRLDEGKTTGMDQKA